ncbi:MAG: DUF4268 domain-containing protein [Cytophagales bacterium]|nr:DUF4268 domain-containing protein [Cytophagales bacterium]
MKFGQLKTVNVRELWAHEEKDFTPWLCENIGELSAALGLDLEVLGREVDVGGFYLDVLAKETSTNRNVVIENQFGQSNHDHLGKLLTYAGGKDAGVLVWIAEKIREEHRQAIDWINEHTDENTLVFGLELNAFRIDDSKPVFQFRTVAQPNDWAKESKNSRSTEVSSRSRAYQVFFQGLIDELRDKYRFTNAKLGQPQSWYSFTSGFRGVKISCWFGAGEQLTAEIYLDVGNKDDNKRRFDLLKQNQLQIEQAFGTALIWERLDEKQASRICVRKTGSISDDDFALASHREWLITQLLLFKKVWQDVMLPLVIETETEKN